MIPCRTDGVRQPDCTEINDLWRDDLAIVRSGSGITFDGALEGAGVPTERHRWVVNTTLPGAATGPFRGPLVATMRWLTPAQAIRAVEVTARFPHNHGPPIHLGHPAEIGADLADAVFGGAAPPMPDGLLPVFWACGVTPQAAAEAARPELMITHAPARSFITDLPADAVMI